MAGTVDIIQRAYTGIETRGGVLYFNPYLPEGLHSLHFDIRYRKNWLDVKISDSSLSLTSRPGPAGPIRIGFREKIHELRPGNILELPLD